MDTPKSSVLPVASGAAPLLLSVYGRHSSFSALWLAAGVAIGYTFCALWLGPAAEKTPRPAASLFRVKHAVTCVLAFLSLSVGVKYFDLTPLIALLACSVTLASVNSAKDRRVTLVATAVVGFLSVVPLCQATTKTSVPGTVLLRSGAAVCTLAYGLLVRRLDDSDFRIRECLTTVGTLLVSGYVATAVHTAPSDAAADSYLTPLALMLGGTAMYASRRCGQGMAPSSVSVGIALFLIAAVVCVSQFGWSLQTALCIVRDVSCCAIYCRLTLMMYSAGKQNESRTSGASTGNLQNSFVAFIASGARERKLAMYLALTVVVMVLEFGYGVVANSLGLVSDSFHMLLDAASLGIGLFSAFASSWVVSEKKFPFGFSRYETVSGFVNGTLLLFIALYIMVESVERILDPPEIEASYLLAVSIIGLLVNVLGIVFFHEAHGHSHSHAHEHGHGGCSSSGVDHNMRGVYLHILADLLGSVSVIVSSLLMRFFGWWVADPVCSAISATLVFFSAFPLLEETGKVLLLCTPDHQESLHNTLVAAITQHEEVAGVSSVKMWVHSTAPREKLVLAVAVTLKDSSQYLAMRDRLREHIASTLREMLGHKNIFITLHLE